MPLIWNHISSPVSYFVTSCILFKRDLGMVFCFILHDTGFVCPCAGLTCGMYCVTFAALRGLLLSHYGMKPLWCWPAVCSRGGPLSERRVLSPPLTIVKPPSPPFHPETWHLYLLAGYASHTPTNLYARFLHLCSSRRCLSRARGSAHSSGGRSLSRFHWGRRAWVQLPVSGLMDGLSDFIWAGRTLRWLGPRDCHSWLLYQGLTYRAVILSEQGSQAPRSAIPPSCLSRCHPGTLARLLWLARRLPPTHPGTDTLTNVSWFINSTLGC